MRFRRPGGQCISTAGLAFIAACALLGGWTFSDVVTRFIWLWLSLHS